MPSKHPAHYYFDTVTISNVAQAECLGLLFKRYGKRVHVTHEVLAEILDGIAAGHEALRGVQEAIDGRKISLAKPLTAGERTGYLRLLRILGPGEASCIVCAESRGGIVATDDRTARACCSERGVRVTGTIGVLKACCLDGTLTAEETDKILEAMIEAGFHSPVERISRIL